MLTLTGDYGTFDLEVTFENLNTRFTLVNGFCGNLAEAILTLSPDRDVYFVTYNVDDTDNLEEISTRGTMHFLEHTTHVVVASDDVFLDSYGVNDQKVIEEFYDGKLIKGTRKMIQDHYTTDTFMDDFEKYLEFAKKALDLEVDGVSYDYNVM